MKVTLIELKEEPSSSSLVKFKARSHPRCCSPESGQSNDISDTNSILISANAKFKYFSIKSIKA